MHCPRRSSSAPCSDNNWTAAETTPSGLRNSWAMPPAMTPREDIFSEWRSWACSRFRSVRSWPTATIPATVPASSRIDEQLQAMGTVGPLATTNSTSMSWALSPRPKACSIPVISDCFSGTHRETRGRPAASAALKREILSAAGFQVSMLPSGSMETTTSLAQSTTPARCRSARRASSTNCSRSVMSSINNITFSTSSGVLMGNSR